MRAITSRFRQLICIVVAAAGAAFGIQRNASATEFSVSPIRAEFKPGALSETITVTNDSATRLRVNVKLMAWTQDATGKDVYTDSNDLIYFPRQLEVAPGAKRLVRVGAKNVADGVERTYRLFIEEVPEAVQPGGPAAVTFYFRFGVPIFLPPPVLKPQPEVLEPTLEKGRLSLVVRNPGNRHFRVNKVTVADGSGYMQEIAGWYSLAGSTRTYAADIPAEACRKAKVFTIKLEGDGVSFDRNLNVDPTSCS